MNRRTIPRDIHPTGRGQEGDPLQPTRPSQITEAADSKDVRRLVEARTTTPARMRRPATIRLPREPREQPERRVPGSAPTSRRTDEEPRADGWPTWTPDEADRVPSRTSGHPPVTMRPTDRTRSRDIRRRRHDDASRRTGSASFNRDGRRSGFTSSFPRRGTDGEVIPREGADRGVASLPSTPHAHEAALPDLDEKFLVGRTDERPRIAHNLPV